MAEETKKIVKEFSLKFPNHSAFMNNVAQAVEIYNCLDSTIRLIDELKLRHEEIPKLKKPKSEDGIGVTEAPRGTLYHGYKISKEGIVKDGNIIVPTSQNARAIEKDIEHYIPSLLDLPQEKIETVGVWNSDRSASISAKLYHDASQKDGTPIDKVIATIPGKNLDIFIAGLPPTLTTILRSFKFIP